MISVRVVRLGADRVAVHVGHPPGVVMPRAELTRLLQARVGPGSWTVVRHRRSGRPGLVLTDLELVRLDGAGHGVGRAVGPSG